MILKIKSNENKWVYFDKIDKFVNVGRCVITNGDIKLRSTNESVYPLNAVYLIDSAENHTVEEVFLVELTRYRSDDCSYFSRSIIIQEAYLLNDEGKTIEKIA